MLAAANWGKCPVQMPDSAQAGPSVRTSLRICFALLGQFRFEYFGTVAVSSILSAVEGIVHPLLIKAIFDQGVLRTNFHRFVVLAIAYVTLGLLINLAGSVAALWSKSLENRILKKLSRRMLGSYFESEYATVLHNGHGYFINRIYGDLREGLIPMLWLAQSTISSIILLTSSSLVLIYLSWKAFLILGAIIPISSTVGTVLGRRIRSLTSQEREQEGAFLAVLTKALGAFRVVRGFDLFSRTANALDLRLEDYFSTTYQKFRVSRLFQALNDTTMVISDFLSMFVGALFVLRGALSFGAYLAFINTFWRAVTTLMQVFNRMTDFHALGAIVGRIASFLSSSATVYYLKGASPSVEKVSFSYGKTLVLSGFSLHLSHRERVVLIGPNGSGKTTLANILSGYLAPSQGNVILPERISSVTLPIMFPPLRVNEMLSDSSLLSAFGIHDQALLDAFADELSAGQQQKLAIALALSRDADLYVIDEPLANLDRESRDVVMEGILDKTDGKNLIVIMHGSEEYHRLFDRVIQIDRVPEFARLASA